MEVKSERYGWRASGRYQFAGAPRRRARVWAAASELWIQAK